VYGDTFPKEQENKDDPLFEFTEQQAGGPRKWTKEKTVSDAQTHICKQTVLF
jgi:hypothetical protein